MADEIIESTWFENVKKRIILILLFIAIAVLLGYAFMAIPNIEFITLIVFFSGFIMGKRDGIIMGTASSLIYFGLNPFGFPPIGVYLCQVIFYAFDGFLGGLIQNYFKNKEYFKPKENLYLIPVMVILAIIGAIITLIFDIFTSIFYYFVYPYGDLFSYIIGGLQFNLLHIVFNAFEFLLILPGLTLISCKLLKK